MLIPELYCSNLPLSLIFFTEVLGFTIQYERENEGFAMLERQGSRIMLDQIVKPPMSESRTWLSASLESPFGRGVNFQIKTDAVDKLYKHVQKKGAHIFLPIENKWYRKNDIDIEQRQFIVVDPDGYLFRFIEMLGKRKANNE